jgi:hypothetical protein
MRGHVIVGVMTISTDVDKLYDTDLTGCSLGADCADVAGSAAPVADHVKSTFALC